MAKKARFLHIDFDPDLRVVQQDLARIASNFADKRELMGIVAAEAKHDVNEMFDNERDATGTKWPYWKETPLPRSRSYAHRAEKRPNVAILNRDDKPGGLRDRATAWEAFVVTGNTVTYGHGLPDWAGVHLHGGLPKETKKDGMYAIPQRSFYPFSAAGVAKVNKIFAGWAAHNIAVIPRVSSRGRVWTQVQTRAAGGRFGSSPL